MTNPMPGSDDSVLESAGPRTVNLERYVPAYLTWIANKLSRGASQYYLSTFDVGIEIWRCLVLLAIEEGITAQQVSAVIGMDKSSVSRCFKTMQARGLISTELDIADGRVRKAVLTPKGRHLHSQMVGMALDRERAFLSVLKEHEVDVLLGLLQRLHANLPTVELSTQSYLQTRLLKVTAGRQPKDEENP
ncbi:winged helix-turn-helix transcriptional regulator [Variovorax paradoxus]|nr:winged helix-turn-helix transcriptional regulator [Variovorax paradoxus]